MHVDRARFLMLTSALAAACGPKIAPGGRPPEPEVASAGGKQGVVDVPEPEEAEPDPEPAPSASGCDDMRGDPPSCRGMRVPGPTCEQGMNVEPKVCDAIAEVAKPRVAEEMMSCLIDRSREGGQCGPDDWTGDCAERALAKVCVVDKAALKDCQAVEARCKGRRWGKGVTADQCARMVSAALPEFRDRALTCVSEGCGVDWCFSQLAWAKAR